MDNFEDRLKAIKPRVAFQVPNTLTGEGNLSVDVTFDSMEDFLARRRGEARSPAWTSSSKPGANWPTCSRTWTVKRARKN